MNKFIQVSFIILTLLQMSYAQSKAPQNIQAALFIKVLGLNKNLAGDITLHVMDNPSFANEMKKHLGKKVGTGTLKSVTSGATINPQAKVVYFSNQGNLSTSTSFTKANKAISITGDPSLVKGGASLGIGVISNKPKILININSAKAEGSAWNPAIFKIAKKVN